MEAVAYLNGQWTDAPSCVEPGLASLGRTLNDRGSQEDRDALLKVAPRLVGLTGLETTARILARVQREVIPESHQTKHNERVAVLLDRRAAGDEPTTDDWAGARQAAHQAADQAAQQAAQQAAWSAARSARSAAWAAAWAAEQASSEAAEQAASAAVWAAWAAAAAAWSQMTRIFIDEVERND